MQLAQLIQARGLQDSRVRFRDLRCNRRAQRQAVAWAVADYAQWHKPDDVDNESACIHWAETVARKLHKGLRRADPSWRDLHWTGYFVSCARSEDVGTNQRWPSPPWKWWLSQPASSATWSHACGCCSSRDHRPSRSEPSAVEGWPQTRTRVLGWRTERPDRSATHPRPLGCFIVRALLANRHTYSNSRGSLTVLGEPGWTNLLRSPATSRMPT
jgi:hypothetical protein